MFRIIASTGFVVVFAGIASHLLFSLPKRDDLFGKDRSCKFLDILRIPIYALTLLLLEQKLTLIGKLRKLLYLLALLCFVVLVINGFYPSLILGKSISGYWIMLHTTAGGVFTVCIAILAVLWAHNCRLDKNYWPWLTRLLQHQPKNTAAPEKYELCQKICFWLIIFLALPLILSIIVSMLPLFGTEGQKCLLQLHRYSALSLALIAIIHTYLLIRTKMSK
ncbi:MAG: cytochrome b/b6 domain-containing protein [Planctomycetota bacterium]|jgi:cytochrome b subunit of formate dehydrogenase